MKASQALASAVRACRPGGSIVIAECATMRNLLNVPVMAVLVTFADRIRLEKWNWWQMTLASVVSMLLCCDAMLPWAARNLAQSRKQNTLGRIGSVAWSSLYIYNFVKAVVTQCKSIGSKLVMMKQAGLVHLKVTGKPMFRVAQVLEDSDFTKMIVGVFNLIYYPGMVVICEGTKQNRSSSK